MLRTLKVMEEAAEKATAAESKALDIENHVLIVESAAGGAAAGEDADCAGIIVEGAAGGEAAGDDADCAGIIFEDAARLCECLYVAGSDPTDLFPNPRRNLHS